jgi:GT2 family glycosyltransferase
MIDIIIVNWNSGSYLSKCVNSIFETNNIDKVRSILIIDNNSSDSSIDSLKANNKIKLIRNKVNIGFAKACNVGFKLCTSQFILLLNPDTRLLNNTLSDCLSFMNDNKAINVLGCQLLNDDGAISPSCSRFPTPIRILKDAIGLSKIAPFLFRPGIVMTDWDHKNSRYVDQVMGAFMLMQKSVFEMIGYFDEQFFVYYEEVDFSKRLAEKNGRSFFNSTIQAVHIGEGTTRNVKDFRLFLNVRSRVLYAKKHFSNTGYIIVWISSFMIEPFTRIIYLTFQGKIRQISQIWKGYRFFFTKGSNDFKNL